MGSKWRTKCAKRLLSKEQRQTLIQEENIKTTDDIQRVLKEMFGDVLQEALETKLEHGLDCEEPIPTEKRPTFTGCQNWAGYGPMFQ